VQVSGGCWPTAEQTLLLQATVLRGSAATSAWERWAGAVDIDELDSGSIRLLPQLYRNLEREGVSGRDTGRLKGTYRRTWYLNQLRLRDTARAVRALQRRGIEPLLLKGIALVLLYYRDPGLRPMDDVDVLVPADRAEAATAALVEQGWRPRARVTAQHVESHHAMTFTNPDGHCLDLHWHLLPDNCGPGADAALWERARAVALHGTAARAPDATDQLFHVCAHGVKWEPIPPLRWIVDAATILAHAAAEVDWARLARESRQRRLVLPVRDALGFLHATLGIPVPDAVLAELRGAAVSRVERWEYRLRTRPTGRALGRIPEHWLRHRRVRADRRPLRTVGFVRYLQIVLDCDGLGALARRALFRRRHRAEAELTTRRYERELRRGLPAHDESSP
jgi:hypothetical protein